MSNEEYLYGSTNFKISSGVYGVLVNDCFAFGYIKNDEANLSGFINDLIPRLSKNRERLHEMFLKYNHYNKEVTKTVEENLYNVYLKNLSLNEENTENIPFRINNKNREDFIYINDLMLPLFNMDFTNYIRSLLNEYAIKPFYQRELFHFYYDVEKLEKAIKEEELIKVYLEDEAIELIPFAIENHRYKNKNYLCGTNENCSMGYIITLSQIKRISYLKKYVDLSQEQIDKAYDFIYDELYKEEE